MIQKQLQLLCFSLLLTLTLGAFAQIHTVKKRESLTDIARSYNMTPFELYKLNPHVKNGLNEGETLRISKVVPKGITLFDTYKVGRKETLFGIGQKLGISVEDIKKHNTVLYDNELKIRQILLIPVHYQDQAELKSSIITYTVKPKDTKWRVAYLHNMTLAELEQLNPDLGETLSIGQVLTVSNPEKKNTTTDSGKYDFYTVKPKETIFSLTKSFDISETELKKLNPTLENGLKAGMILKIPAQVDKITFDNQKNTTNLATQSMKGANIKLAVMLPFGIKELQADTLLNLKKRFKKDRNLDVVTDFYTGVLVAIDSARSMGLNIQSSVFDTENSEAKVSQIIRSEKINTYDAVIGPLYQKNVERAGELLKDSDTKIFSPLTNRDIRLYNNCFQTLPTQEILEAGMLSFLKNKYKDENVVIITDTKLRQVASRIKNEFPKAVIIFPDSTRLVKRPLLLSSLEVDKQNWVIVVSENVGLLTTLVPLLDQLTKSYKITLMTTDRNKFFEGDEVSSSQLAKLNFHFPSVEKPFDVGVPNSFVSHYFNSYGISPGKYAVRGFDLTFDVIMRLASSEVNREKLDTSILTEYLENRFAYEKKTFGGYYNKAFYIIKYDGYNLIEAK